MQTLIILKFSAFCESEEQKKNNIFRTSIKPKQTLLYKFFANHQAIFLKTNIVHYMGGYLAPLMGHRLSTVCDHCTG
jgi:hypothetical protein